MSRSNRRTLQGQASPILDDLRTLEAEMRGKADDYLRSSKAYTCRSNSDVRAGLVKGAAVFRMDADRIAAIVAKYEVKDAPAVAKVTERTQAPHWPLAASAEPSDQDAGHVDLSGVQEGYGYA